MAISFLQEMRALIRQTRRMQPKSKTPGDKSPRKRGRVLRHKPDHHDRHSAEDCARATLHAFPSGTGRTAPARRGPAPIHNFLISHTRA
jgi:hypothetical protein